MISSIKYNNVSKQLLVWYELCGRKDLPWQTPRTPYRVWVSEIMLQQTQVKTVIPYFERFMHRFPDIHTLASATQDEVLAHWSGLGYYSRGRNLHHTASIIRNDYNGNFPCTLAELKALPGIGPSTAAAIASLAFNKPTAILDGNVARVLSRYFLVDGLPNHSTVKQTLWSLANACMPEEYCTEYTQAIMDLGATCCTSKNPNCSHCPLQLTCKAYNQNLISSYPFKKIKKTLPVKHQQFLVLHTDKLIYLEKNPPSGLWGGLWCLPHIDLEVSALDYVHQTYPFFVDDTHELMRLKHTFSHFQLHIEAQSIRVRNTAKACFETQSGWFKENEMDKLGLAKPVRVIIDHFYQKHS